MNLYAANNIGPQPSSPHTYHKPLCCEQYRHPTKLTTHLVQLYKPLSKSKAVDNVGPSVHEAAQFVINSPQQPHTVTYLETRPSSARWRSCGHATASRWDSDQSQAGVSLLRQSCLPLECSPLPHLLPPFSGLSPLLQAKRQWMHLCNAKQWNSTMELEFENFNTQGL